MKPEKDVWSWIALVVLVVALFALAFSAVTHIGGAWGLWASGIVFLVAMCVIGVRSWRRARDVVYTEEQIEAVRLRYKRLFLEMIWTIPIGLGAWVPVSLVQAGMLPQWAGGVLLVVSLVAALGLRFAIRNSRAWKGLN